MARLHLALVAVSGVCLTLGGCTVCHETIQDRSTSPDGKWTTATVTRECGALTAPLTGVYLQPPSAHPRRLGEIVFIARHPHAVSVRWTGPQALLIACPDCGGEARVKRPEAHGIRISYDLR